MIYGAGKMLKKKKEIRVHKHNYVYGYTNLSKNTHHHSRKSLFPECSNEKQKVKLSCTFYSPRVI